MAKPRSLCSTATVSMVCVSKLTDQHKHQREYNSDIQPYIVSFMVQYSNKTLMNLLPAENVMWLVLCYSNCCHFSFSTLFAEVE